jgi:hypothetical protein
VAPSALATLVEGIETRVLGPRELTLVRGEAGITLYPPDSGPPVVSEELLLTGIPRTQR